jgi:hypothetical protein
MVFSGWFSDNVFNLLGVVGVIFSLCFTAFSLRSETKTRRISNLLAVTANHREVWNTFLTHKSLERVRDATANLLAQPVTDAERIFVNMVIQHLNSVYRAMNDQLFVKLEGLRRDVAQFFSLPIPLDVWEKVKVAQNDDFVAFVDSCRNWK